MKDNTAFYRCLGCNKCWNPVALSSTSEWRGVDIAAKNLLTQQVQVPAYFISVVSSPICAGCGHGWHKGGYCGISLCECDANFEKEAGRVAFPCGAEYRDEADELFPCVLAQGHTPNFHKTRTGKLFAGKQYDHECPRCHSLFNQHKHGCILRQAPALPEGL